MEQRLWHLIAGSDGGYNRALIILALDRAPDNTNQLAERLDINYNTARYHLQVLHDHGIVESSGDDYGEVHFLTEQFYQYWDDFQQVLNQVE